MKRPPIVPGDFFRVCDRSGFRVLASQTAKEWNNLIVFVKFYEPRQPQDLLRGIPDNMTVPDPRPKTDPTFLTTNQVQPGDL